MSWSPTGTASRCTNAARSEPPLSSADLLTQIRAVVGDDYVIDHREDLLVYEYDGSVDRSMPRAVVLPDGVDEVSRVMALGYEAGVTVWDGAAAPDSAAGRSRRRRGCRLRSLA